MIAAEIKLLNEALQQTRFTSIRQSLLKRIYLLDQQSDADASGRIADKLKSPNDLDGRDGISR